MTDTSVGGSIDLERNKICSREHGRNYERRRKIPRVITGGLSETGPIGLCHENSRLERSSMERGWREEEVGRKTRRGKRNERKKCETIEKRNYSDN